ncbi:hypothetical protein BH09BAC4_BH09BAC4_31210 [soil metagenome]
MKEINPYSPVHLIETVLINATPQQVWVVMTGVDNWPDWQPNITRATLAGDLSAGSAFTITNAGDDINATFHTVTPYHFFGWESHYEGLAVTHNWTLVEQDGQTLVQDEEGMEGAFAEANKASIQASIETSKPAWLGYLKREVERRTNQQV